MEQEYRSLKERWLVGERDRELRLRLMFFAWMHWADPSFVTGLTDDPQAMRLWHEIFAYSGGENSTDVEFIFVAGTMAEIFPYALGNEREWAERGSRMIGQAMQVQPSNLPLSIFNDRGNYGEYFAHQLRGQITRSKEGSFGDSGPK